MFYSEFPYKKQKQTPVSGIITGTVTTSEQMVHYSNFNITGTTKESKKMASPKINNLYICEKPSQARDLARILGLKTKHDELIKLYEARRIYICGLFLYYILMQAVYIDTILTK